MAEPCRCGECRACRHRRASAKYKRKNRIKENARRALAEAVAAGVLERPARCDRCGMDGETQAHHDDYDAPLLVAWLCVSCHGLRHRELSTRCANGHEWTDENTYVVPATGDRQCRACHRDRHRAWKQRRAPLVSLV